ncbi:MAG: hypothetical protein KJ880_04425 [Candidatus Omnitrophica bacterium]|nr:hypothetical protein [Candidatus Omnitrophota bacterium]MBU1869264.1 hypothetical protein [Candidatus Omnitrophota bacterium]
MARYSLEFILYSHNTSSKIISNSLSDFSESIEIAPYLEEEPQGSDYRVSLKTEDPTLVFDACTQLGRIKSIKVGEIE